MAMKMGLLFLAGGCGCWARYGLTSLVLRFHGGSFPLATLLVNLIGCLLFGFVWSLAEEETLISVEARFLILTGFMGSFTTFSSFAFESTVLLTAGQWIHVLANVLIQFLGGVLGVVLGIALGRLM